MKVTLKAIARQKVNQTTGAWYLAWNVKLKDGTIKKLKFRKDCAQKLPTKEGRYDIVTDLNNVNQKDTDYGIVFWVSDIESYAVSEIKSNISEDDIPF